MPKLYKLEQNCGYLPRGTERFISTEFNPSHRAKRIVDINSERMRALYDASRELADREIAKGQSREEAALSAANTITNRSVPTGRFSPLEVVRSFFYARKMPLDYFIENGGVCTHFSLVALSLLQKFREDGYISGEIRVAANRMLNTPGHSWVIYEYPDGERAKIVDPTNHLMFSYTMSDLKKGMPQRPMWEYTDRYGWTKRFDYFDNSGLITDDFVARGGIAMLAPLIAIGIGSTVDITIGYYAAAVALALAAPRAVIESIYEKRVTDITKLKRN